MFYYIVLSYYVGGFNQEKCNLILLLYAMTIKALIHSFSSFHLNSVLWVGSIQINVIIQNGDKYVFVWPEKSDGIYYSRQMIMRWWISYKCNSVQECYCTFRCCFIILLYFASIWLNVLDSWVNYTSITCSHIYNKYVLPYIARVWVGGSTFLSGLYVKS